ncbi:uncharacterized protein TRIADDRAFT_53336 [Trichoplax adhaerens]|uniref:Mitotic checkpoint protein BUB3 n=1 Tax=Trichoplax adhaerens TaxID=10228 RepID=B3RNY4_TRIAD|nr:hypothetical protein TRIADDRAFT_53336 [Trichoplax adhaerens]EDV27541.1 hypothetical protein TRIADDRAFT_53336 [Trichoplax adhaerens]|eukprot:XP_002109375.1 hypothetical protein TRIADDRAFT_53336 [Trichoplax adhaerens]
MEGNGEFLLKESPTDGISSLTFSSATDSNALLVSSWDKSVRLYDVDSNSLQGIHNANMPVLDCCFYDKSRAYSGGLDCKVICYDFNSSFEKVMGKHEDAVRCVEYCPEVGVIISGSWDKNVKVWDPRHQQPVITAANPERVYTMSCVDEKLIVGTAARKVLVWDLRNMNFPQQRRESSLKYQTRCIRCFPNKQGYVLSSIEGRVAVEYFDPSPEIQKMKYAFKCHRVKDSGNEIIHPVNAISFHNGYNTFATGGSDGFVNIWDGFNKKRLCQFHRYPTSIASLSFNATGTLLAIASSYLYEEDKDESPAPDSIYIRRISDAECKPK